MKKLLIPLIFCALLCSISGCVKECFHCEEMLTTTSLYVKDTDTVKIVQMGAYYYYNDTLVREGYNVTHIESTIPVDVDFCKEKSVDVFYYQSCTKLRSK